MADARATVREAHFPPNGQELVNATASGEDLTTGSHVKYVKYKMGRNPARTASGDWNICLPISQNTPLAIIVCIHAEALRYASSKSSSVTSPRSEERRV